MRITGATEDIIRRAIRAADPTGNLQPNRLDRDGRGFQVTLRVDSSRGAFHKRGYSGRRMVAACWHGHYRFMRALFDLAPDAGLSSMLASYAGKEDFERKAPYTADHNIGSIVRPLAIGDACDCETEDEGR